MYLEVKRERTQKQLFSVRKINGNGVLISSLGIDAGDFQTVN